MAICTICTISHIAAGTGDYLGQCGAPATVTLTYGCVHEHIATNPICAQHAAQAAQPGILACTRCWDNGNGHICTLHSEK